MITKNQKADNGNSNSIDNIDSLISTYLSFIK